MNAKKENWGPNSDGEHWSWVGGDYVLINDKNEILIDSLNKQIGYLNWYSMQINNPNVDTSIYITMQGTHGNTYSFVDYEKEFKKWFYGDFLESLSSKNEDKVKSFCFSEITYSDSKEGWVSLDKNEYFKLFPNSISLKRFTEDSLKKVTMGEEDLNEFIYTKDLYNVFYNACRMYDKERYPLFEISCTHYKRREKKLSLEDVSKWEEKPTEFDRNYEIDFALREEFDFIRTEDGYKLLTAQPPIGK